jgi:sulfate transport system permease protein
VHDQRGWVLALALFLAMALLILPLANIGYQALLRGPAGYLAALADGDTIHSIFLTLVAASIAVPVNLLLGVAAAWAVARHRFRGRTLLITLIDLPMSISPVIAGLAFVLIFGSQGWLGRWLEARDIQVLFALPAIVLTTLFTTFPFVAREVMPVLEASGADHEEAARTLGAGFWQTFRWVVLPNIRWGVIHGTILCTARAFGEYGAVSVVSGKITGETDTVTLRVEKLYQEYQTTAAFAVASILVLLALATLAIRSVARSRLREGGA